jgi:putative endonuclease
MTLAMELGHVAENIAASFLEERGYTILDKNYRKPWGELDIIAKRGNLLVFSEVKANASHSNYFSPEIRANWSKMRKVARTAQTYLLEKKFPPQQEWQVDVISVTFNKERRTAHIKHFKNVDIV